MQVPPTITFRRMPVIDAVEVDIRKRLESLGRYYPAIMTARVMVEPAARHHRRGNRYQIRIDLTVPGEEIAVKHAASLRPAARARALARTSKGQELDRGHRYLGVAVREAFAVARRRLQDYGRLQRGAVKLHEARPEGRVVRLFPSEAYGFLEAQDGHEVYFRDTSVLDGAFRRLKPGSRVAFVEERGNKGPQASTVRLIR